MTVRHQVTARAVLAALLLLLAACQNDHRAARFENYLARLGRTLDQPLPGVTDAALPRPPRPGQLKLPVASSSLDTLDFLAISGCAVQVTIGKRNSSLGRMASASQRLLLELEFLALAPECIDYQRSKSNEDIALVLEQAWQLKQRQLPALIFNATLGGQEYRDFWRAETPDPTYPGNAGSQVITALEAINMLAGRWLSGDYRADNQAFELLLSEVAAGDGGALMNALAQQDAWLAAANKLVDNRRLRRPLCAPGYRPDAVDILDNVIARFFIGEIQGDAAALGRRFHELLPPLVSLETDLQAVLPVQYASWQHERNARLQRFAAAPRRHVETLKALRAPCETGTEPGNTR
jgi:hypothetical protein